MADLTGPNPDEVNGIDARGATVTGKPVLIGGTANSSIPSAVSAGQAVDPWFGLNGLPVVSLYTGQAGAGGDAVNHAYGYAPSGSGAQTPFPQATYGFNGTTWDRLRTTDALDAAPNTPTGVMAAGVGPGFDIKLNPSNLATAANSTISDNVSGSNSVIVTLGTTTTGTITFEVSGDDSTWIAADVIDTQANTWVSGTNITPTSGKTYRIKAAGWRQWRIRTVSTLGATVAVKYTMTASAYFPEDLDPAPHSIGYAITSFAQSYSTTQTSTNLVAGTSGQRIYVTGLIINVAGTTAGRVSIYWGTGAFTAGSSPTLFDGEFVPSSTAAVGMVSNYTFPPGASSSTGDNLRITTSTSMTIYVTVVYYKA